MSHPKALFIVKHREEYSTSTDYPKELKSGLYNSAKFIAEMLHTHWELQLMSLML